MIALLLAAFIAAETSVSAPAEATIQIECGVTPGTGVDRIQAACIAQRLGVGQTRWWVRKAEGATVWEVSPRDGVESSRDRKLAWIHTENGRVVGLWGTTSAPEAPLDELVHFEPLRLPSIQEHCRIEPFAWVTEGDAKCLAKRIGMPIGHGPWKVLTLDESGKILVNSFVDVATPPDCQETQYRVILQEVGGDVAEIFTLKIDATDECEQPSN